MKVWKVVATLMLALFVNASFATAQTPTPTPTPVAQAPGWVFSTSAGYSNVSNAPTNNGFANVTELRLSQSLVIRGDMFLMTNPQVIGAFVGPEYLLPASRIFKPGPNTGAFDAANVEFFANVGLGDLRSTDPANSNTKAKFAWKIGGGFNLKLSDKTFIRPLDISYIRGSVLTGTGTTAAPFSAVLGNHLQFSALVGVRF